MCGIEAAIENSSNYISRVNPLGKIFSNLKYGHMQAIQAKSKSKRRPVSF